MDKKKKPEVLVKRDHTELKIPDSDDKLPNLKKIKTTKDLKLLNEDPENDLLIIDLSENEEENNEEPEHEPLNSDDDLSGRG